MTLRRKCTGAKHITEIADSVAILSGRGAFHARRRCTVRSIGDHGSENAGVSSEMQVRILHTGSPRDPEEGSSALGKSGPNARPKGVVDGKQADIPAPTAVMKE